jgi:hypothetical protein
MREIACIDRVDRAKVRGVGAIDVALDDIVKRGAGGRETQLDLFENDPRLFFDRQPIDFTCRT